MFPTYRSGQFTTKRAKRLTGKLTGMLPTGQFKKWELRYKANLRGQFKKEESKANRYASYKSVQNREFRGSYANKLVRVVQLTRYAKSLLPDW